MRPLDFTFLMLTLLVFMVLMNHVHAQGGVKYCKNLRTGEIVVVESGYPCPWGTVEIRP